MKTLVFLPFFCALLSLTSAVVPETLKPETLKPAAPPRWEKLGERKVNYGLDRDEIIVTASEGRFTALKFKVEKGGINLHKVVVHFGNGSTEELELRNEIPGGGESRVLDLPGNKRIIQKVVFWYDTKNFANQKAHLELWGRH